MFSGATTNVCVVIVGILLKWVLRLMNIVNCIERSQCVLASFMHDSVIASCPSLNLLRGHIIADFNRLWLG